MKQKYFFRLFKVVFTFGLLLLLSNIKAQNRFYLDFDGSNDYVYRIDNSVLDRMNNASEYTIEAWIYISSWTDYQRIANRYSHWDFYLRKNGQLAFRVNVYNNSTNKWEWKLNYSQDNAVSTGSWQHVAVIRSGGKIHFYVNGSNKDAGTYNGYALPGASTNDHLYIGQFGSSTAGGKGTYLFNGYIDEFRCKNVATSVSDLHSSIYDNQYEPDANTGALFHFNEGTGTSTKEETQGYNATLYGTPDWTSWDDNSDVLPLAHVWTGDTDSDWANSGNWNGGIPGTNDDVIIPQLSTCEIGTSVEADCHNLLLEIDGSLEIMSSSSGTGSLIISGSVTNNEIIYINRYITAYSGDNDGWHFLSSPIANYAISGSDFEPTAGDDDLYEYDETASSNNWLNYNGGTFGDTEFEVGKGYLVAYKTAGTKTFFCDASSNINTGSFTKNLSYTSGASSPGWNLLGNPYTAAIDWDDLTKTSNVDGSVYVIRASDGQYISWNGSAGDLTDGYIPAMQGFFVKVTASGESITMDANDQVHYTSAYYKKSTSLAENTIRINVSGETGESNEYIQFRDDATVEFDHAIDAYKLFGFSNAPQIYTNDGKELYSINCLPLTMENYDVLLGIKTPVSGTYTLYFEGMENIANTFETDFEDTKTGQTTVVTPGFTYTFNVNEGDNPDRFVLHFYNVTSTPEIEKEHSALIYAYNNSIILKSEKDLINGNIEVVNLLGQVVFEKTVSGTGFVSLRPQLENGVYIVRYKAENGSVQSEKIILQ